MSGYDDSNLRKLFAELEPKQRKQVFRRAFRKGAAKVRKVAVRNVKGTTLHHKNELSKGVRSVVYKRDAGFRVTVAARAARMNGKVSEACTRTGGASRSLCCCGLRMVPNVVSQNPTAGEP